MAKRLGETSLSNAEKQRRFRQRKKTEGLYRKEIWTDKSGFLAKDTPSGVWAGITLKQLESNLRNLTADFEGWEKEVVYADIFEYAKLITKKYEKTFTETKAIAKAEGEKHRVTGNKKE
jgi:hypothetical protein